MVYQCRMRTLTALAAVVGLTVLSASPAPASMACTTDPRVAAASRLWVSREALPALAGLDPAQAKCFKQAFVASLQSHLGRPVGYKVGLFSKAAQTAYQTDRPLLGYLYSGMLLRPGAKVPVDYAIGATWESDLLLVVKDAGINDAGTREQIYAHLRGYRPFIELPGRNYAADAKIDASQVEALNVGARLGVMGEEYALPQTPGGLRDLVNYTVEVTTTLDGARKVETGKALDNLGDVLEIVRFARDQALAEGHKLKAGDLLSIGVVTPARAPIAGQNLTIRYDLVAGQPVSVSADFVAPTRAR